MWTSSITHLWGFSSADALNSIIRDQSSACSLPNCLPKSLCNMIPSLLLSISAHSCDEGIFMSFIKLSIKDTTPLVSVPRIRNPSYSRTHNSSSLNLEQKNPSKLIPWKMMSLHLPLIFPFIFGSKEAISLRMNWGLWVQPINNPLLPWLVSTVLT